jgi:hypothetical protein
MEVRVKFSQMSLGQRRTCRENHLRRGQRRVAQRVFVSRVANRAVKIETVLGLVPTEDVDARRELVR